MIQRHSVYVAIATILILTLFNLAGGRDSGRWRQTDIHENPRPELTAGPNARDAYSGTIRVYVTEASSRWTDPDSRPFVNGFLAFALEEEVSLNGTDSLTWVLDWHGQDYYDADGSPFDDIQEDNVKVVAAVFNAEGYPGYSYPPSDYEFTVHEVDACAAAECGTTGYNLANESFTHTVLIEDGTTDW